MFAFGLCVGGSGKLDRIAMPALEKHAPGAPVILRRDQTSIFDAYNSIVDECVTLDVEGLVLMHDDVELRGDISSIVRSQFADPRVAIVGAVGGRGVRSVRWFRANAQYGHAPDSANGENRYSTGPHDVDIVDGLLIALSPWAIRNLRFDSSTYRGFHAYDADISMQARAAGKVVRVTDVPIFHHTKGGFGDAKNHRESDDAFRRKWGIPQDSVIHRAQKALRGRVY